MNRRSLITLSVAAVAGLFVARYSGAAEHDFPKGSPKFETSYKSALAEAKKTGKPVVAIFSAVWCSPCQLNKKTVYPSEAVKPYHDKFVWAYLDADLEENQALLKQFKQKEIPYIQLLDKNGKVLDTEGRTSAAGFAKKLAAALARAGK